MTDIKGDLSTRTSTTGPGPGNTYTILQAGGVGPDGIPEFFEGDGLLEIGTTHLMITVAGVKTPEDQTDRCPLGPCFAEMAPNGMMCGPLCLFMWEHPLAMFLAAPGYDHDLVDSAADQAALQTRYGTAYQNEIASD